MSSQPETGHAKNVANLASYNQFIASLGTAYNPSVPAISSSALTTMHATALAKMNALKVAEDLWKIETNKREVIFSTLPSFSTRLLGTLSSMDVSQQTIDDFSSLVAKMRGNGKKSSPLVNKTLSEGESQEPIPVTRSSSQQSYDQKIEHFSKMVLLLQSIGNFTPNETTMQVSALQTLLSDMTAANSAAVAASVTLKAARIDRNTFLYAANTGMIDIVKKSKAYISGVFGKTSQQYKAATAHKFIRVIPKGDAR